MLSTLIEFVTSDKSDKEKEKILFHNIVPNSFKFLEVVDLGS